jgi:hypothetical protein
MTCIKNYANFGSSRVLEAECRTKCHWTVFPDAFNKGRTMTITFDISPAFRLVSFDSKGFPHPANVQLRWGQNTTTIVLLPKSQKN